MGVEILNKSFAEAVSTEINCMQVKIKCLQEEGDTQNINKPSESNDHTTQLRDMASTLRMRTTISPWQWQHEKIFHPPPRPTKK